jgi:hypothetical protein
VTAPLPIGVPFVIRGRVIDDLSVEHRVGDVVVTMPDPRAVLAELPLASRVGMADLHSIAIEEIVEFLGELGTRLRLARNAHLQHACAVTVAASNLTASVVEAIYEDQLARFFEPRRMLEAIDRRIGREYLEGWVHEHDADGRDLRVRAFGARTTHVVAGNSPGVTAQTVVRNALTRGDAIIKTPANDPVTAVAILRTMIDLDPDHPVTRHVSAVHWRGGDELVEQVAFASPHVDKIVAWGGSAAIKHVASFVGPGVELIALDAKISIALLGREVVTDPEVAADAARRLAIDVGMMNQEACVNARIAYLEVGDLDDFEPAVRAFASRVFDEVQLLDPTRSTPVEHLPPDLRDEVDAALLLGEPEVVGGGTGAGGVLVSWDARPVDFSAALAARYVNLVPVPRLADVLEHVSSTTQTCGVFPAPLRERLRDGLALAGVQRIATLGTAAGGGDHQAIPQDGIEVLRRMCRWIVDEADRPLVPDGSASTR